MFENLLSEQHGFIPGRSTFSNLMCFTQYVASQWDTGDQVDFIYTDFSEAFDRQVHSIILAKAVG